MTFIRTISTTIPIAAFAAALGVASPMALAQKQAAPTPPAAAQQDVDQTAAPTEADAAQPAGGTAAAAPAAEPAAPAAPQPEAEAAPEAAPAPAATASTASLKSRDIAIGSPVFGTDGKKIGVVNRVLSDAAGTVSELQVAPGGTPGLGVPVIVVPAEQIASGGTNIKLSLTADQAKSLPKQDGSDG